MDNFKIGVVFELEKDHSFINAERMKKEMERKYNLTSKECSYLYRLIVNYQIEEYHQSLHGSSDIVVRIKRTDNIFKRKRGRR